MTDQPISDQIAGRDQFRKDLEDKIEKKLPSHVFYWVMGIVVFVFGALFFKIDTTDDKIDKLNNQTADKINELNIQTAVIESKIKQ